MSNISETRIWFKGNYRIIGIIVAAKLLIAYWYSTILYSLNAAGCVKHLVFIGGDTSSYLEPFNNLIAVGKYFFINEKAETVFIGRGPYYGLPYYFFRFFFNKENAYIALSLVQFILDCFATFLLYKLVESKAAKTKYLPMVLVLMLFVILNTILTIHLTTESMSMSLSIISLWYFLRFTNNNSSRDFWISSILFCWMITLKPYLLPLGGVLLFLCALKQKKNIVYWSKKMLLFYIPLIIIITPYTLRNVVNYHRFIPFQDRYAGYGYNEADIAVRKFIQAFGGSIIYWDQNAAGSFFFPSSTIGTVFRFPDFAMASCYNLDSLKLVAKEYTTISLKSPADPKLVADITGRMNRYTDCLSKERPYVYYVKSRIELMQRFVLKNGSYFLPRKTNFQLFVKVVQALLYFLLVGSTLICTVMVLFQFKRTSLAVLYAVISAWYPVIIFPILLKSDEWRYFDTAYPFMVFLTAYLFLKITKTLKPESALLKE